MCISCIGILYHKTCSFIPRIPRNFKNFLRICGQWLQYTRFFRFVKVLKDAFNIMLTQFAASFLLLGFVMLCREMLLPNSAYTHLCSWIVTGKSPMGRLRFPSLWGAYASRAYGALTLPEPMGRLRFPSLWGAYASRAYGALTLPEPTMEKLQGLRRRSL